MIKSEPRKTLQFFKKLHNQNPAKRKHTGKSIRSKYPNRYPILVDKMYNDDPALDRHKFLVPSDFNVGQFIYVVRNRMRLRPEVALFFFAYNPDTQKVGQMLSPSIDVSQLFAENCSNDNFLYIGYTTETAFGNDDQHVL